MRLQTVGIRGLIDELIAALDSTLTRSKMVPAFLASVLIYLGMFGARALHHFVLEPEKLTWLPVVAGTAFALLVLFCRECLPLAYVVEYVSGAIGNSSVQFAVFVVVVSSTHAVWSVFGYSR